MPDSSISPNALPPSSITGGATASVGASTSAASSPFPLLEAERQRLEQFTRDQLAQISRARDTLLAEKRNHEQALEARRLELERQGQLVRNRLQELHEREKKAGERVEDALPERSVTYRRRRYSSLIDKRKLEEEGVDPEVKALREQLQDLKQNLSLVKAERDAAFDELQRLRRQPPPPPPAEEPPRTPISRDTQRSAEEIETLRRQVQEQQGQLDQMKSERDVALAEVQRLVQEPEDWARQEEEIVALNRELRQRENQIQEELQLMNREHQRLEKTLAEYQKRGRKLDQDREELENHERESRFREEQLRLREAELREMRDMIEKDNIQARKELVEERQQVVRLRELLRQERENPRPKTPPPV
jgi:chromosome segregation ATPase